MKFELTLQCESEDSTAYQLESLIEIPSYTSAALQEQLSKLLTGTATKINGPYRVVEVKSLTIKVPE